LWSSLSVRMASAVSISFHIRFYSKLTKTLDWSHVLKFWKWMKWNWHSTCHADGQTRSQELRYFLPSLDAQKTTVDACFNKIRIEKHHLFLQGLHTGKNVRLVVVGIYFTYHCLFNLLFIFWHVFFLKVELWCEDTHGLSVDWYKDHCKSYCPFVIFFSTHFLSFSIGQSCRSRYVWSEWFIFIFIDIYNN
jgi:hypothetical protein